MNFPASQYGLKLPMNAGGIEVARDASPMDGAIDVIIIRIHGPLTISID